jgi:hypothetical protein
LSRQCVMEHYVERSSTIPAATPVAVSADRPSSYRSSVGFGSAAQDAPMLDAAHPSILR